VGEIDSSWIKPGVEVVVICCGSRQSPNPRRTTVLKVATQSFTVDGMPDRFKLTNLRGKSVGDWTWYHQVVKPDSVMARRAFDDERLTRKRNAAITAVARWNTGDGRDDLAKVDAAIDALRVFRAAVADG
jgi:hypothetical protein